MIIDALKNPSLKWWKWDKVVLFNSLLFGSGWDMNDNCVIVKMLYVNIMYTNICNNECIINGDGFEVWLRTVLSSMSATWVCVWVTSFIGVFSKYLMRRLALRNALFCTSFSPCKLWGLNLLKLLLELTFRISVTNIGTCSDKASGRGWEGERPSISLLSSEDSRWSGGNFLP